MKAQFINEKFTEDSDPVKDMGIGLKNNPKLLLPAVVKKLKEYNINVKAVQSFEFGPGFYDLEVQGNGDDDKMDVQYYYSTDAAAKTEGWPGGFSLGDDGGADLCKISHDPMVSIKALIKRQYGTKAKLAKYIIQTENKLRILKEVEKII